MGFVKEIVEKFTFSDEVVSFEIKYYKLSPEFPANKYFVDKYVINVRYKHGGGAYFSIDKNAFDVSFKPYVKRTLEDWDSLGGWYIKYNLTSEGWSLIS